VQGSPYPRSYYRCIFQGCGVRKAVERHPAGGHVSSTVYRVWLHRCSLLQYCVTPPLILAFGTDAMLYCGLTFNYAEEVLSPLQGAHSHAKPAQCSNEPQVR
jgi:WRKY DNA -binding domain